MNPRFEVGDIIKDKHLDVIMKIDDIGLTVGGVLAYYLTNITHKNKIVLPVEYIDKNFKLDKDYKKKKQFDKEMKEIIHG